LIGYRKGDHIRSKKALYPPGVCEGMRALAGMRMRMVCIQDGGRKGVGGEVKEE